MTDWGPMQASDKIQPNDKATFRFKNNKNNAIIIKIGTQVNAIGVECCTFAVAMKYIAIFALALLAASCAPTEEEKAAPLLAEISSLYEKGEYKATLDSITVLRERFPKAVEARRKALTIWQDASLKMAQDDVAKTDGLLQEATTQLENEADLYKKNMLRVRCDSLRARYEAMCGVVRMIHARQKQAQEPE